MTDLNKQPGIHVRVSQLGHGPPEVELTDAKTGEHVHWDAYRTAALREFSEWLSQFTANFKRYESNYKEAGGAVPEHVDSALGVLSHVSAKLSELGLRIEP